MSAAGFADIVDAGAMDALVAAGAATDQGTRRPPATRRRNADELTVARYRVLAWREIQTQVEATDASDSIVKRPMPRWFMQEISRITMHEGLAGSDDYLAESHWWEEVERDGTADEVADAVSAELCARFGRAADGRRIGPYAGIDDPA